MLIGGGYAAGETSYALEARGLTPLQSGLLGAGILTVGARKVWRAGILTVGARKVWRAGASRPDRDTPRSQ